MEMAMASKDRRPALDAAELRRSAKRAKAELLRAREVPVPDADAADLADLDHQTPSGAEERPPAEAVLGRWSSLKGMCRIFTDSMTNRLSYEESLEDGGRLHGWLERQDANQGSGLACWEATLRFLDQDEQPWYGPSFGEEHEALGEIRVQLFPGGRLETSIKIDEEDEEWQPAVAFRRRTEEEEKAAANAVQAAATSGAFVFGA